MYKWTPFSRVRSTWKCSYIAIASVHSISLGRISIWTTCDAEHHVSMQEEAHTTLDKWFGETDGLKFVTDKSLW